MVLFNHRISTEILPFPSLITQVYYKSTIIRDVVRSSVKKKCLMKCCFIFTYYYYYDCRH